MKLKTYIQFLILSLVIFSTAVDALYVGTDFTIETKIDFEKDSESSEKEKSEKKDSKYLEDLFGLFFVSTDHLSLNFTTKALTITSYINEELIPPEV